MLDVIGRRGVLAAGGAVLVGAALAACTTSSTSGVTPEPTPTGADDPDLALRTAVVEAESALIAAYDATVAAHPSLAARLAPMRANHLAHRATVGEAGLVTPSAAPPRPTVPSTPAAAVAALAALEKAAARARGTDCARASRWQFARELSLVGGCEAAHHALLVAP